MSKIDKKELHIIFSKVRNNDKVEFDKLYKKYKSLVYGVAFSILKNNEDSEEIVQSVFMKIFKLEKEKLPKENEASWLYTFSKNVTLNFLRTKKEEVNIDEVYYIADESKELEGIIEKDTYNRIISRLNEKEQEIVSLKILSNLSFKEISNVLGIPIGTVQWKYYKVMHTLKLLLSSLSMYILTIFTFIIQKDIKKIKKTETQTRPDDKEQEEIRQEETKTEEDEQKKQETIAGDDIENSRTEINNTITNSIDTETQKSNTITNSINIQIQNNNINANIQEYIARESKYNEQLDLIDIGILSISSIFMILSMIFLIFLIKSQQKAKRKVSK